MYLQCFRCRLCPSVPNEQLKFHTIGAVGSQILVVDSQANSNIQMSEEQTRLVPLAFDEDNVNEQTIATIGAIFFTETAEASTTNDLFSVFGTFKDFELTWAVRCATPETPPQQMIQSCGIYSRPLFMNRKVIAVTEPGYEQLLAYLPLEGLPSEFKLDKLYRSPYGILMTIKPLSDWTSTDVTKYQNTFRKAKREVGLP